VNETFKIVAAMAGGKLSTPGDLKELQRLEALWKGANDTAASCTTDAAFNTFLQQGRTLTKSARAAGAIHNLPALSREDIEAQFLQRGEATREAMRQITAEARPTAMRVAEKFCDAAREVTAGVEKTESELAARFGLAYVPSNLVQQLRRLPDMARQRIPNSEYSQASPQSMVPFLPL
jgi:ketosteroid isomerase-like protein